MTLSNCCNSIKGGKLFFKSYITGEPLLLDLVNFVIETRVNRSGTRSALLNVAMEIFLRKTKQNEVHNASV